MGCRPLSLELYDRMAWHVVSEQTFAFPLCHYLVPESRLGEKGKIMDGNTGTGRQRNQEEVGGGIGFNEHGQTGEMW